jgi:hypothetical protein
MKFPVISTATKFLVVGIVTLVVIVVGFFYSRADFVPVLLGFYPQLKTELQANGIRIRLTAPNGLVFPENLPITVWLETAAGIIVREAKTRKQAEQTLFFSYQRAGLILYRVKVAEYVSRGELTRVPANPIHPLKLNVGARAVRLDTSRPPALVMHPLDAQGNVSNTPITVTTLLPNGQLQEKIIRSQHLVAWTWLPVGRRTGLLRISAQTPTAFAERSEVDLLSGATTQANFSLSPSSLNSATRDDLSLSLRNAQDQFGNPAVEGSAVEFSSIQALTWNFFMVRSLVRSTASAKMSLYLPVGKFLLYTRSEKLLSSATGFLIKTPRTTTWQIWRKKDFIYSSVIRDSIGAILDDGTPIKITVWTEKIVHQSQTYLKDGEMKWQIPQLSGRLKQIRVSFLGQNQVLRF